ncbi:hypothetical protein Q9295_13205 [Xinfangfangia sp. CPCC 101601]|uniref:Response regulator n=1 Tax=Pseudogemmobacter lacusdianii TaxID=3069608 RepID=A0ABU0VZZ6_9RHOB|nr:hypothetical protein [Xinfangfangia sp. CPCC 101601]MDQ2067329.1 hypothetical protein [Xinfangfangia sp. CPCC 101601]
MQLTRDFGLDGALPVGWGVRVMVLSNDAQSPLQERLAGMGGVVEHEIEVYAALSAIIDDPAGYGLFVVDCDSLGGVEVGARVAATLTAVQSRVPVILISEAHSTQVFPQERDEPVCLRGPVSVLSLRMGFEHALRDRLVWRAA